MSKTPRARQAAHLSRLLKRRGGETKNPLAGRAFTFKYWLGLCQERQPIKSSILQKVQQ